MRTRTSIKMVFIVVTAVSVVLLSRLFFVLMFDYYKEGVTTITKTFLEDAAKQNTGGDSEDNGIVVRHRWQDCPDEFKQQFDKFPTELGQFQKRYGDKLPFQSPKEFFYVLYTTNGAGEPVYVGKRIDWSQTAVQVGNFDMLIYWRSVLLSVLFAALATALLLFVLKRLVSPLENLKNWAQTLAKTNSATEPIPNEEFRFREFSEIAEVLSDSINTQRAMLDKEQEFLQFASHELRSPLALMRGNAELLSKLSEKQGDAKISAIAERLESASSTMTLLVNTLLWLSRAQAEFAESAQPVELQGLLTELVSELNYLLDGKPVKVQMACTPGEILVPPTVCRIVLSNLIANAFQHAASGEIWIRQQGGRIEVLNDSGRGDGHEDSGFGLGLKLVEKLALRFHWQVRVSQPEQRFCVELTF
ncbi:sensor histidine kinase [Ferrimonas aestuarii]|uniref:histidine kinase n=1 Tax=Ferrimonas aestuarii TaxID=2569539 RepID=A0A4U1BQ09_9GAMM|nr:HAMP domain-containing sensor histidine kinase [Ferrimonas aestuarii]TKB56679.1 HAMP domain-containing histidine kinase [Ferrimonas aestuarii]